MSDKIKQIFGQLESSIHEDGHEFFLAILEKASDCSSSKVKIKDISFKCVKSYLDTVIKHIDNLGAEMMKDETILISVSHQKLLRTCYQLVTSFGILPCLIPGLGMSLSKRSAFSSIISLITWSDQEKFEVLVECTDFISRSYSLDAFKKIILTFHFSDYIASLIQLSFAPLKKPGTYSNYIMTQDMYKEFLVSQKKYQKIYLDLVQNSFQPLLMKELLVLQSVTDPSPPAFAKKVIAKELSSRLVAEGGLLSLIRCFIETRDFDIGQDWNKVEMICKIIIAKHGNTSENEYLENICSQLEQILSLTNTHYLATATACVLRLNDQFSHHKAVKRLMEQIFLSLNYDYLLSNCDLPGTVILSPQEVEQKVNILHVCVTTSSLDCPSSKLLTNLYILFLIGIKCTKNEGLSLKLKNIILKCLELSNNNELSRTLKVILFGLISPNNNDKKILVVEYEAGVTVQCVNIMTSAAEYPKDEALEYFLKLFDILNSNDCVQTIFVESLQLLIDLSSKRESNMERMLSTDYESALLDEQYVTVLHLLSELSSSSKVNNALKLKPSMVFNFIKYFISTNCSKSNEECVVIALVLLSTILSNTDDEEIKFTFRELVPILNSMINDETNLNNVLCKETLSLITLEKPNKVESAFGLAVSDVFDNLLPVRAHGVISLTKLIEAKDPETISKKHYVFCLFQEQLKNSDSYLYLAAINGIASLGMHCTEDVLHLLCQEFIQMSLDVTTSIETKDYQNESTEMRMKIGDILVKITKGLGEMAIVHKTILLNTILCGCRDPDSFIRTSALSNLAEIARVIHYRIGSIIYEVLLCIWSVIQSDEAVECRRAAVMVISSLLKGLGKDTLVQLKDNLLPIYRTLMDIYRNHNEDSVVRLHAQIALEELNDIVNQFLFPELKIDKKIYL